jgi:hypothetical protein
MCSEGPLPGDPAGEDSQTERKEDEKGGLDKVKDKLTGADEERAPGEGGAEHHAEEAPPPGEEPTPGHNPPKSGPA